MSRTSTNPSDELLRRVKQARCGGAVQRCHGIRHVGSYSNAEHQWGVAVLLFYLYPEHYERLSAYALFHDVPEGWVGDIPAPTLRHVPGLRASLSGLEGGINEAIGAPREDALDPDDHLMLKVCDRLELLLWCKEQMAMGNLFVKECMSELVRFMDTQKLPGDAATFYLKLKHAIAGDILPKQAGVMEEIVKQ